MGVWPDHLGERWFPDALVMQPSGDVRILLVVVFQVDACESPRGRDFLPSGTVFERTRKATVVYLQEAVQTHFDTFWHFTQR